MEAAVAVKDGQLLKVDGDPRRTKEIKDGIRRLCDVRTQALGVVVAAYPSHPFEAFQHHLE